jgi:hypothetical protein
MKILKSIQLGNPGPVCENCVHFQNHPAVIEEVYAGLTTLSSGYASVRHRDGICNYHQLYLSARDGCQCFTPRTSG